MQGTTAPPLSDRLLGRASRFVRAHPYLAASFVLHTGLAAAWLHTPGLGEAERSRSVAAVAQGQAREREQTEARRLEHRVATMAEILQRLAGANGRTAPPAPQTRGLSVAGLAAQATALSTAIDAEQAQLRAAAYAEMNGLSLRQAERELAARSAAELKPPRPDTAAESKPAATIERLEQRARDTLEAQRSQLEARQGGVPVTVVSEVSEVGPDTGTGQTHPADGIPRSLAVQLAAEFRNGPPQGRVGEAGFEGGRSINPKWVEGQAGGRLGRPEDTALPTPGHAATGKEAAAAPLAATPADSLSKAGGRVIGPGGAFATRIYLDSWYVVGPFEASGAHPMARVYPPEEFVDLDASYLGKEGRALHWAYASRGFYPFRPPDGAERALYYAYTELRLDQARDLRLDLAADDDAMLWIDGVLIWASTPRDKPWAHPPWTEPDEQVASLALVEARRRVRLAAGTHRLLVKLYNASERRFFSVVLTP